MTLVDLSTPPPAPAPGAGPPAGLLDALPRRVALTLPELRCAAQHAGGAPLPFDVCDPQPAGDSGLESRLGRSRGSAEDDARAAVMAALHEPVGSLTRRGLLVDDVLDEGLAGALGLLAVPDVALDLDVAVRTGGGLLRARAWHRQAGGAVATLATIDGVAFELAWFAADHWPAELARVAVLPEDHPTGGSSVPAHVDLPYELADAAAEAVRSSRPDLLAVLAGQEGATVRGADGTTYELAEVLDLLAGLSGEAQGRLRAMVADTSGPETTVVGVVSWTLLADGWHALRTHRDPGTGEARVEVRRVEPADLGPLLAPVLAEVTR
ncbi:ESX secretion-associated protein EspG [Nocardioides marmotae]|uniref:ESX secretion-associated protein EspG n=1 Tax=Nocardioides marmotae TaxID=2663857 RepID=UPI0012B5C479|nr:ESX secretion-associated protein EspG [Nocardioides marmotae]MBC9734261.1 ESX secretion-associated protein EspG [Nocardioides marmotae]MTB85362.1 hypothetical protein [Nocardioides marmotae]